MIPPNIMAEHRALAAAAQDRPASMTGAAVIVAIWLAIIALVGWFGYRYVSSI